MYDLLSEFEQACAAANLRPIAVLQEAGIHRGAWARWKSGRFSPTLKNFEAARAALKRLEKSSDKAREASAQA